MTRGGEDRQPRAGQKPVGVLGMREGHQWVEGAVHQLYGDADPSQLPGRRVFDGAYRGAGDRSIVVLSRGGSADCRGVRAKTPAPGAVPVGLSPKV